MPLAYGLNSFNEHSVPQAETPAVNSPGIYQEYMDFFEKVYETMDKNYYRPVTRDAYDRFLKAFNERIYGKLKEEKKSSSFIRWRSAAYLVDYLKDPEDTFSAFFPPKAAEKYEKQVLGQRVDLGIEGILVPQGYEIVRIEPRSDAYGKGLREKDILTAIDNVSVKTLAEKDVIDKLTPLIDTTVKLDYIEYVTQSKKTADVTSMEYFKQTVFMVPVDVPGVYCLEIKSFNRKTSEDMLRYLSQVEKESGSSLILDLRGNPGGPPLAAREISAFFLESGVELAYFQKKGYPKAMLSVPEIPPQFRFKGQIAILVDEKSGSASELFSGTLQRRKRAVLFGTNTAGKVFLKSMFNFDDNSMLLLITSRGFYSDGAAFDFKGVVPDYVLDDKGADLIGHVAKFLAKNDKARN